MAGLVFLAAVGCHELVVLGLDVGVRHRVGLAVAVLSVTLVPFVSVFCAHDGYGLSTRHVSSGSV